MKKKIIAYYSILIGFAISFMWIGILKHTELPEGKTELSFHLVSEFLMSFLCMVSGLMILRGIPLGRYLNFLALGMVIYSVLNGAGYYAQQNVSSMVVMFLILFFFTTVVSILNLSTREKTILNTETPDPNAGTPAS